MLLVLLKGKSPSGPAQLYYAFITSLRKHRDWLTAPVNGIMCVCVSETSLWFNLLVNLLMWVSIWQIRIRSNPPHNTHIISIITWYMSWVPEVYLLGFQNVTYWKLNFKICIFINNFFPFKMILSPELLSLFFLKLLNHEIYFKKKYFDLWLKNECLPCFNSTYRWCKILERIGLIHK